MCELVPIVAASVEGGTGELVVLGRERLLLARSQCFQEVPVQRIECEPELAVLLALVELIHAPGLHGSRESQRALATYVKWLTREATYRSNGQYYGLGHSIRSLFRRNYANGVVEAISAIAGCKPRSLRCYNEREVKPQTMPAQSGCARPLIDGVAEIERTRDPGDLHGGHRDKSNPYQYELCFTAPKAMEGSNA